MTDDAVGGVPFRTLDDVNGRILAALYDYATFRLGPDVAREKFAEAASRANVPVETAIDARGWVRLSVLHAVSDSFRPLLGGGFIRDALMWAVPVRRDFSAMSISALSSPALLYTFLDRSRTFFAHHLRFEVTSHRGGVVEVTMRYEPGVSRRPESCDVAWGVLRGIPLLFGLPSALVEESACYANGADACRYTVRYRREPPLALYGTLIGAIVAVVGSAFVPNSWWFAAPLALGIGAREVAAARRRKTMTIVAEDHRRLLEEHERDFERRYRDLAKLNAELEERVAARTKQIETAMSELRERNATMRRTIDEMDAVRARMLEEATYASAPSVQEFVHELRNPLMAVITNLEFLQSSVGDKTEPSDADELSTVLHEARVGAERLSNTVAWFVDAARDANARVAPYDIDDDLRETVALLKRRWGTRIEFALELGQVGLVESYAKQLSQVFANVLANAGEAMETGNISIKTESRESSGRPCVVTTIADDGPGIEPALLPKIFDRGVTTKGLANSGLGLFISNAIVRRHGGTIRAESTLGSGTTFFIEIPRRVPRTERNDRSD